MRRITILATCVLMMFLAGCAGTKDLEIINTPVERQKLDLDNPPKLKLNDVEWYVVTPDTIDEIFQQLEKEGKNVVLFALTDDGYEILAENQLKIRNYLLELRSILDAYREYYENE